MSNQPPTHETTTLRVRIKGDHPHSGESGRIEFVDGKAEVIGMVGAEMFLVVLDNCRHGNRGCYATRQKLELLRD